ncbi:hypothetical protein [Streptomyces sp. NBC_01185]|nr:hypothetical protein OG770_00490 [Streptomyces sp. NBC_01185]
MDTETWRWSAEDKDGAQGDARHLTSEAAAAEARVLLAANSTHRP